MSFEVVVSAYVLTRMCSGVLVPCACVDVRVWMRMCGDRFTEIATEKVKDECCIDSPDTVFLMELGELES